ncbi:multifunctional expression regulator [Columbid alphaherpesvirus 1]|uniref:Multifunctional expression regulator n=1 Tax=Columbid alphaherpesvirus 1 TaxID=93386 RepID=A0A1V0M8K7_9ALPH|nr:multifunctional expression regulator [Columbid alphaherpesvirus 1]ARD71382.1 multifunctional expression regulator [Columbid alphaherpesvirus 1]
MSSEEMDKSPFMDDIMSLDYDSETATCTSDSYDDDDDLNKETFAPSLNSGCGDASIYDASSNSSSDTGDETTNSYPTVRRRYVQDGGPDHSRSTDKKPPLDGRGDKRSPEEMPRLEEAAPRKHRHSRGADGGRSPFTPLSDLYSSYATIIDSGGSVGRSRRRAAALEDHSQRYKERRSRCEYREPHHSRDASHSSGFDEAGPSHGGHSRSSRRCADGGRAHSSQRDRRQRPDREHDRDSGRQESLKRISFLHRHRQACLSDRPSRSSSLRRERRRDADERGASRHGFRTYTIAKREPTEDDGADMICPEVSREQIAKIVQRANQNLLDLAKDKGFRAHNDSPWAGVLTFACTSKVGVDSGRLTWEQLLTMGPELRHMFEVRPRAAVLAAGAREAVLRNENLVDTLAAADEALTWFKLHATLNLMLLPNDPILATTGAVLDNLRAKLNPVMTCRYLGERRSIEDLLRRSLPTDMVCPVSLTLIMLSRISKVARRNHCATPVSYIDPFNVISKYLPGGCMAGILSFLDVHMSLCSNPACRVYISCIITPMYNHGRYFYCNDMF